MQRDMPPSNDLRPTPVERHMGIEGDARPVSKGTVFARLRESARQAASEVQIFFRSQRPGPKIFCIGFNKTGTTSLGKALQILGYDHSSFNRRVWEDYYLKGRMDKVIDYTRKFSSFDDLPWLREDVIPVIDRSFPGSQYIYLERDEASWKRSLARWGKLTFGQEVDVELGWQEYLRHRRFVLDYFASRSPSEFLVLDVRDPIGFRKLAAFLGRVAPQDSLPHSNRTDEL